MRILAIDTTSMTASVAICEDNKTIVEFSLDYKKTHSQTVMPLIDTMFKMLGIEKNSIDFIACACGPGSFTGLRIGAATSKGIALGLGKKIIPVPSLDALAYNITDTNKMIVPIIDARRNQVFAGIYSFDYQNGYEMIGDYLAQDFDELLDFLRQNDMEAVFLGDGVLVHKDKILSDDAFSVAPINLNMPKASAVGAAAFKNIDKAINGNEFEIMYLRKSQAEREFDEREGLND